MLATKEKLPWAVEKHALALAGTAFEKCATCHGTTGKLEGGQMLCSRINGKTAGVSAEEAKNCDGRRPSLAPIVNAWPVKTATKMLQEVLATQ